LTKFIERTGGGLLIGESDEQEEEFYSATVTKELAPDAEPFVIGICSEGNGVTPQLLALPAQRVCLIGVNCEVVALDVETRKVAYRIDLNYSFRNMINVPTEDLILAFHETGACAFREDGSIVWRYSRDLLEAAYLRGSTIYFEFMDSEPTMVDVGGGKETVFAHREC
jgi:hypothetical protein